jgi:single-strand DNA-binding protein
MSDGINKCMFLGNLTRDSELRQTTGGEPVLSFSVACSESYKDKSGNKQEKCEFVNCVLWGRRAASLAQYLTKGTRVFVEGRMETRSWEKDGKKHYKTEIKVNDVSLQGGGKRDTERAPYGGANPDDDGRGADSDIPFS